jgi:DNA-directed RNA polymerase III subunit RPC8
LQAIERNLKESLTDRVIHNVGLVVSVYDILEVGEGTVFHSEGGVHYRVHCRPVVFCPVPTELIVGTISQMNE